MAKVFFSDNFGELACLFLENGQSQVISARLENGDVAAPSVTFTNVDSFFAIFQPGVNFFFRGKQRHSADSSLDSLKWGNLKNLS